MSDRELLELAAKAAGIDARRLPHAWPNRFDDDQWNPLIDDGEAFRLAAQMNLDIRFSWYDDKTSVFVGGAWDDAPEAVHELFERDVLASTRRAIVRAVAEIAKAREA